MLSPTSLIIKIITSQITWICLLIAATILLAVNYESFTSQDGKVKKEAREALEEIASHDPEAAKIIQQINDEKQRQAFLIAAHSAGADDHKRSTLAGMAKEMAETKAAPYRAQLAELVWDDASTRVPEELEAYLVSHALACEMLSLSDDKRALSDYLSLLRQAHNKPNVWRHVKGDPVALSVWAECGDGELLEFYGKYKDLFAEDLSILDPTEHHTYNSLAKVLQKLKKHESCLEPILKEAELGIFGLVTLLTHGGLIESCYKQYNIDPGETAAVIYLNPTILGESEGTPSEIQDHASYLATIEKQDPIVWECSKMSPFALQLHKDAPHVSGSILEKYGYSSVQLMIYRHFSDPEKVAAAASAIDVFGDLAIYVFNRYDLSIDEIGNYLVDPDIGIRVIPFMIRFDAKAFEKIKDNRGWVDRYYDKSGKQKVSPNEWIKEIPGGAVYNVASNWAKGHPNEWSEIGWAAFDGVDIALTVASFGTSKAVTTSAKVGIKSASRIGKLKVATRTVLKSKWDDTVKAIRNSKPTKMRYGRLKHIKNASSNGAFYLKTIGKVGTYSIWSGYKISARAATIMKSGVKNSLRTWKSLQPTTRKFLKRGLAGGMLFISLSHRTIPNLEKIAKGMAGLIGKAAANLVKLPGVALNETFKAFLDAMMDGVSSLIKKIFFWLLLTASIAGTVFLIINFLMKTQKRSIKVHV